MKKVILLLLSVVLGLLPSMAQSKDSRQRHPSFKQIVEFKLKFLAQEMELKADQKDQFVELYTEMMNEKKKLFSEIRTLEKKLDENNSATDDDYARVSDAISNAKVRDAEIEKRYDDKFSTFLSSRQIFKMKSAEDKFRDKMNQMRHKKRKNRKLRK